MLFTILSRTWVRIALGYTLLLVAMTAALAYLLGGEFESREEEALRIRLADQARAVAYSAGPLLSAGAPLSATNSLAARLSALFGTRVTIIRPDGTVAGDSEQDPALMENHATRPEVMQALSDPGRPASSSRLSATVHRRLLYVGITIPDPADPARVLGVARVAYPMTSVEQARYSLWQNLLLAVVLTSLPALLLSIVLARSIAGPLSALRDTAYRFGRGNLTARARIPVGGEVGELAREFDAMADRLSHIIRQRTSERNQMTAVFNYMHDGIIITDSTGHVEGINPAGAQMLGVLPDRAVGRSMIELIHSHKVHEALQAVLKAPEGGPRRIEIEFDGRTLSVTATAVPDSAGSMSSISSTGSNISGGHDLAYDPGMARPLVRSSRPTGLVVLQDVTELRRLERVRRDFVANISHELRTPLASIKLLVETLRSAVHEDPRAADDFLQRIDVELDRLTHMVRELLELSRIESGQVKLKREAVSVPDLLERAASRLRPQAERSGLNLTVCTSSDGDLPPVYADAERIEQVLVNLLHNAIKFTPAGGQITVRAEPHEEGVCISVQDTGIGIPPEDLPRIFERFYKVDKARASPGALATARPDRSGADPRQEGGTGLGLAIARHVVQAHGGRIWASSQPGQGSTFYFTLPAPHSDLAPAAAQDTGSL
jgi:two-component system phosphate regulon sensor histidine kinase PhoR